MLPKASFPLVNGVPTLATSPITDDYDYGKYNTFLELLHTTPDGYVQGYINGYKLLTSGLFPDVPMFSAMETIKAARIKKNGSDGGYGAGGIDLWRLMVECGLNVQTVIDKV